MSRKFFAIAFGACLALASIAAAPVVASAYAPLDPGITNTEHIKTLPAMPDVLAILPAEKVDKVERPTVAVYNTRTCAIKEPDGSGVLILASTHRTFAVPWLQCRKNE